NSCWSRPETRASLRPNCSIPWPPNPLHSQGQLPPHDLLIKICDKAHPSHLATLKRDDMPCMARGTLDDGLIPDISDPRFRTDRRERRRQHLRGRGHGVMGLHEVASPCHALLTTCLRAAPIQGIPCAPGGRTADRAGIVTDVNRPSCRVEPPLPPRS